LLFSALLVECVLKEVINLITKEELHAIFKNSKDVYFPLEKIDEFYNSIRESMICLYAGKYGWPKLSKIESEIQWPILSQLDDQNLDIYKSAISRSSVNLFIKSIKEEKAVRAQKGKLTKNDTLIVFRLLIMDRVDSFKVIFDFNEKDIEYCQKAAEKYIRLLIRAKKKRRENLIKVGLWGGLALGGGYLVHKITKKEEK
jgi:hypothetical protein